MGDTSGQHWPVMKFTINHLSYVLGAEVIGADLTKLLGDAQFKELRQAWLDADGMLVIRDRI